MADDNVGDDYAAAVGDDATEVKYCMIYDKSDFFTIFVQILLALFSLGALWIKRMREKPKRKFKTWFLDVSKQGFGACYAHVLNMVIAAVISRNIRGDNVLLDQCAWYGISFLIDTTLGLALAVFFLNILDRIANHKDWLSLKNSGVYSGQDAMLHWFHQVLAWLLILTLSKIVMYVVMWVMSDFLAWIGGVLFKPLQGNIRFELVFVMILFPGLLNVIYFWIADNFLKAKAEHADAHESEEVEEKAESLLSDEEKAAGETKVWTSIDSTAQQTTTSV